MAKMKIPYYVVDWYDFRKDNLSKNLKDDIKEEMKNPAAIKDTAVYRWFLKDEVDIVEAFKALMSGEYEKVTKEELDKEAEQQDKREYRVVVKNVDSSTSLLAYNTKKNKFVFTYESTEYVIFKTQFTEQELKDAGLGWVMNCDGIDIQLAAKKSEERKDTREEEITY